MKEILLHWECLEKLKEMEDNSIDSMVTDPPYWISFMGKKWDYDVPQKDVWAECLRVLKPWGHALIACWTRTQHRMAVNLEDWGFEIRDIIAWVYGSWFPKSLNLGKSVDKLQGNEREVNDYVAPDGKKRCGGNSFSVGKEPDGRWINKSTKWTSPHEWRGTALKPAMELRTLCRKPLSEKTIAKNVLKHWTGGINIDECRVGSEKINVTCHLWQDLMWAMKWNPCDKDTTYTTTNTWRFPANLIHDWSDEVVNLFPETKPSKQNKISDKRINDGKSMFIDEVRTPENSYADRGSAARFFYCAKASRSERNKGLEGFEKKPGWSNAKWYTRDVANWNDRNRPVANYHPTVKPIKLMQYLVRLITPKWWTILDPYMWSGSTGIWAKLWGFDFIGIEREGEYMDIARARMKARG